MFRLLRLSKIFNSRPLRSGLFACVCGALIVHAASPSAHAHGALHDRIADLSATIAQRPDDASAHFQLAVVYAQHGEWERALAQIEHTETLAPGQHPVDLVRAQAWLLGNQPALALEALARHVAEHPEQTAELLLRARIEARLGNVEAALTAYQTALAKSTQPDPAHVLELADLLSANSRNDEAVAVLADGIEKCGPAPELLLHALRLELATKRFDAALTRVEALQKTAPQPQLWMAKRASILAQAGRPAEARAAYEALLQHINALPNLQRGSRAMAAIADQARAALGQLPAAQPALTSNP